MTAITKAITSHLKYFKGLLEVRYGGRYPNGTPSMRLVSEEGRLVATASVNMDRNLEPNYLYIKDWSENEGVLKTLVDGGIVRDTGIRIVTGFVEAALVEVIDPEWIATVALLEG